MIDTCSNIRKTWSERYHPRHYMRGVSGPRLAFRAWWVSSQVIHSRRPRPNRRGTVMSSVPVWWPMRGDEHCDLSLALSIDLWKRERGGWGLWSEALSFAHVSSCLSFKPHWPTNRKQFHVKGGQLMHWTTFHRHNCPLAFSLFLAPYDCTHTLFL